MIFYFQELNAEFHGEKNGMQFQELGIPNHQRNGFKYENGGDNSDCYIVDLENFSNGVIDKEHNIHSSTNNANSRITVSSFSFFVQKYFSLVVIKSMHDNMKILFNFSNYILFG